MTTPERAVDDQLNPHPPWMRRLAGALVAEASEVDDVLQDSWLRLAGRSPEQTRAGYLASVVRSLANQRLRSDGRRRRRERAAASEEALPSTAEVAARIEIARLLAEALEQLEEPYRTTLVLRYFDELSSAEIARRAGVPAATVRARVKRGLERLRALLDARHDQRSSWVGVLLPLARATHPASPLALWTTSLLAMKIVLGLLLSSAALALVWTLSQRGALDGAGSGPGEAARAPLEQLEPRTLVAAPQPELERLALSVERPADSSPDASSSTARADELRVGARAVSPAGAALPRAWLALPFGAQASAQADEQGRLALALSSEQVERLARLQRDRQLEFEVGAPGRATERRRFSVEQGARLLELGEIALSPGGSLHGRVLDADGLGVEGALVVFGAPIGGAPDDPVLARRGPSDVQPNSWSSAERAVVGSSGAGGAFRLEGLRAGFGCAWARSSTSLWSVSAPIGIRVGQPIGELELVLREAPEDIISGRVTDPDGQPLPGLELNFSRAGGDDGWFTQTTDARGRFHFVPRQGEPQDLTIASPVDEWEELKVPAIEPGTRELELHFERCAWLPLLVQDAQGRPIRSARVVGLPAEGATEYSLPRCEATLDEQGRGQLRKPGHAMRLRASALGFRDRLLGPFDPDGLPAPYVIQLEPAPAIVGRVLLPDGMPARGARVGLHRGVTPRQGRAHLTNQGWSGDREGFVSALRIDAVAEVEADDEGRFRLPMPGADVSAEGEQESTEPMAGLGYAGAMASLRKQSALDSPWYLHAELAGRASASEGPLALEPEGELEVELELPPAGAIAGRLVLADEASAAGWTMRACDGMAQVVEARVASDGSFRLEALHAGGWQLRAFEPGRSYYPGRMLTERVPEPDIEVLAGRSVEFEYRAHARENARLAGRLWIDGEPAGPWRVKLTTATAHSAFSSHEANLDPDGRFELPLQAEMRTSLAVFRANDSGSLSVTVQLEITPGENDWSLDFETATIEGRVDPSQLQSGPFGGRLSYVCERPPLTLRADFEVDEEGAFGPVPVPSGAGRMLRPRVNFREPPETWVELDLAPGETRKLEL